MHRRIAAADQLLDSGSLCATSRITLLPPKGVLAEGALPSSSRLRLPFHSVMEVHRMVWVLPCPDNLEPVVPLCEAATCALNA
jgi:hypothetical protein